MKAGAAMKGDTAMKVSMETVMVGGAAMYPTKNIVENAVHSKDHTTLVTAVKAAGLVDTLSGKGPFTVFAPTNEAFAKLPKGTVDTLLKPESKAKLTSVLTYHVVPGKISAADIRAAAKTMNGMAEYKTVEGETLKFKVDGKKIWIMGEGGGKAQITIPDVNQSNGVIHVVNAVLLP
nr:fasciclin domain-containing protein [Kaistia sp. 32K]